MSKKPLTNTKPPRYSAEVFDEIKRIIKSGWHEISDERRFQGHGGPGNFLESLLNVDTNNGDTSDFKTWEIKFTSGNALLTLFHKEPEPRGIMNNMVHQHGWPSKDGSQKVSFRHTLCGETERGFYVVNEADRIIVRHRSVDMVVPHWKHNTISNILGHKLRRLIVVEGETASNPRRVKYNKATAYWDIHFSDFYDAVSKGLICIDFDARTTAGRGTSLRNHGTKFRVKPQNVGQFYLHKKVL